MPNLHPQRIFIRLQRGLTLVETIVATLIVASCVIGIAAIYAQRQNIARGGRLHTHAVELATSIAHEIAVSDDSKANFETTLGTTCTTGEQKGKQARIDSATNKVACWQDRVEQELTNGSARITLDRNAVPAQYIIVVSWSEPRTGTASYVSRVVPGSTSTPSLNVADAARAAD